MIVRGLLKPYVGSKQSSLYIEVQPKSSIASQSNNKRMINIMIFISFIFVAAVILICMVALSTRDLSVLFQSSKTIVIGDVTREYLVSYPSATQAPNKLIMGLHGFSDSSRKFAYYTALHNVVDDRTIVVYPGAIKPRAGSIMSGWNAGFCCGSGWIQKADDVAFIHALIEKLSVENHIKPASVFLVGFSNGAFMAQRFASEKPQMIGGIAVASGTIGTKTMKLSPMSPMPVLLMHGKDDKTVPFMGGTGAGNPEFDWLPFGQTVAGWEDINTTRVPTKKVVYVKDGHKWHDWRTLNFWHRAPAASVESIRFFESLTK